MELIYKSTPENFAQAARDTNFVSEKASEFILQFRTALSADILLNVSESILLVGVSLTVKHEFITQIQRPNGLMILLAFVGVSSAWDYEKQPVPEMVSTF